MEIFEERTVPDETKEACAVENMRFMLQDYAEENGISFEEALFRFSASSTYNVLFDFETAVWKEGPAYIRGLFDKALASK